MTDFALNIGSRGNSPSSGFSALRHARTEERDFGIACNLEVRELTQQNLSRQDLIDLGNSDLGAIVIRGFTNPLQARNTARALAGSALQSNYSNLQDDLQKIGSTLFENTSGTVHDRERLERYLASGEKFTSIIEGICAQYGPPPMSCADTLLAKIANAKRLELLGRPMFAGLVRIVPHGREILPHQDDLGEDLPDFNFAQSLRAPNSVQLAANIYLQVPEQGGELNLWRQRYTPAQCANMRLACSDYGIDSRLLPAPDLVLKPQVGDLVFFDSARMHSVGKVFGEPRVSISFFVGISGDGRVGYWS